MPIAKVNGVEVEFEPGMTVLQVAEPHLVVTLGLDPRVERRTPVLLSSLTQASPPILGSSPRMTEEKGPADAHS